MAHSSIPCCPSLCTGDAAGESCLPRTVAGRSMNRPAFCAFRPSAVQSRHASRNVRIRDSGMGFNLGSGCRRRDSRPLDHYPPEPPRLIRNYVDSALPAGNGLRTQDVALPVRARTGFRAADIGRFEDSSSAETRSQNKRAARLGGAIQRTMVRSQPRENNRG